MTIAKGFSNVTGAARDFIMKCLVKNQAQRWSASQLLNHLWIQKHDKLKHQVYSPERAPISSNIQQFAACNAFQKQVISLMTIFIADKDQLAQLQEAFLEADVDKSGTISVEEMKQLLQKTNQNLTGSEYDKII